MLMPQNRAARFAGVTVGTLAAHRQRGNISALNVDGVVVLYREEDLIQWRDKFLDRVRMKTPVKFRKAE